MSECPSVLAISTGLLPSCQNYSEQCTYEIGFEHILVDYKHTLRAILMSAPLVSSVFTVLVCPF